MDERSRGAKTVPALLLDRVVKTYGPVRAVDGVSFTARPGEFIALLGPNGAGTGLRVMSWPMTSMRPESGTNSPDRS